MADYWKSQPRKFCEFCKCWLTENKPSIEFHEKGKRHQENVRKKIDTIKKNSLSESKKRKEMENDMESLNKAALEAFKKDIINDPSLAKQYGISLPTKKQSDSDNDIPVNKPVLEAETVAAETTDSQNPDIIGKPEEEEHPIEEETTDWYEAVSDEGYHYYWNTKTNESVWEKPEQFHSLQEQGLNEDGTEMTAENNEVTDSKESETEKEAEKTEEVKTEKVKTEKVKTEKVKTEKVKTEAVKTESDLKPSSTPARSQTNRSSSRSAYGQWTTYEKTAEFVDYELPSVPEEMPLLTFSSEEPAKMKFKEKRLTLADLPDGEIIAFKKRKISKGSRNIRGKLDDD
ncbi:domain-binding 4-like [Octopus vulgaris]|uniref:Domain-binding 4-like n=1 Tax=Octopus vulgaris TaxID=6645 RepID=A0AA36B1D6_OCTVU|nr:domain-binding 4-like [Octopus vulgaris]